MALYLIQHKHDPENCPARDPNLGAMLLNHLSRPNARRLGVEIREEAVLESEHTFFMFIEAATPEAVAEFGAPFAAFGSLDIHPASTCVRVVAAGGCGFDLPVEEVPSVDPEEACQSAIEGGLIVHRAHPLNGETSIPDLLGGVVMPNAQFYIRNHFQIPVLDPDTWRLNVGGRVARSLSLDLQDLLAMPSHSLVVTLECAGNGRSLFDPPVAGEQWRQGAVSTAEWTGVPLYEVLDRAGLEASAEELVFRGADGGPLDGSDHVRFERSLALDIARDPNVLLAYAMNGEALPRQHGYPLRLIVPGWYAVASVKWLTEIEAIDQRFEGAFQTDRYTYERERDGRLVREPVSLQQVRSLITEPDAGSQVEAGPTAIRGVAWSGAAEIARVDVSINDAAWQEARLIGQRRRHGWQWWELLTQLDRTGDVSIRSRATDMAGRTQPERAEWNGLGYGNNAISGVSLRVV